MHKPNYCTNCKVDVSADLKYCPLCGKFVLENENQEVLEGENSYPMYDLSYIYRAKWLKLVKYSLILVSLIAVGVNLLFDINCLWFPYVLIGMFAIWKAVFYPFKEGQNHIKRIPITGFILAISVACIDIYDHFLWGTQIGWGVIYTAPSILAFASVISLILALSNFGFDVQLIRGLIYLEIVSVILFVVKLFVAKEYDVWPSFMYFLSATVSLFILLIAKKRRMVKEINRNFHI